MQLRLHPNATTTPRTRAYIQRSTASTAALARELGIHPRTVARWKARSDAADRSTRPHRLATPITAWEEGLILELRRSLALPLGRPLRRRLQSHPSAMSRLSGSR
jgi:transposase-like protein